MLRQNTQLDRSTSVRLIHLALLFGILVGATLLRTHALGKTSYWYDEISSVLYARGQTATIFAAPLGYFEHAPAIASRPGTRPWRDVWFGFDTTPPLYPSLLRIWWKVFGEGDISGRALSVLLSVLTIAALFDFGRLIISPAAALWACALCAASPPMIRYAQEARAYSLLCLLSVLICDVVVRITRSRGTALQYALLWMLCAAALLTHHFVAGGIGSVVVFAVIRLRGRARITMVCVVLFAFVVELWALPILLHHSQSVHQGIDWLAESRDGLLRNTLFRIAGLPIVYLILPPNDPGWVSLPAIVLFVLPFFFRKRSPDLLLAALWPIGVIGLVAASDLWLGHGALEYVRYTLAASPMLFISFAAIADRGGRWSRHLLPALTLAGALLAVPDAYSAQTWIKPESRELAADIMSHVKPGDVLVIASHPKMGLDAAGVGYLGIDFYAGPLPCAVAILESPADDDVRRKIWAHHNVWLVRCFDGLTTSSRFDANEYLGPCSMYSVGGTRLFAGRLYRAQQIK